MVSIFIQSSIFYGVDSPLSYLLSPSVFTRSWGRQKICQLGNSTSRWWALPIWPFLTCSIRVPYGLSWLSVPLHTHACPNIRLSLFLGILLHHCNIYSLVQLHVSVLHTIPREHESLDICEQLLSFKESFRNQKTKCLGYVLSACLFVHLNYRALKQGFKTFFLAERLEPCVAAVELTGS